MNFLAITIATITCFFLVSLTHSVVSQAAPERDPYEVLGVSRSSTEEEIKAAFKALARQYHPDKSKDPMALTLMQDIANAYEAISKSKPNAEEMLNQAIQILKPKLGESVYQDLEILNQFKSEEQLIALDAAVRVFGKNIRSQLAALAKFDHPNTAFAFAVASAFRKTDVQRDYATLLQFTDKNTAVALYTAAKARGPFIHKDYSKLLQFTDPLAVQALEAIEPYRYKNIEKDYDALLQFKTPESVKALESLAATRKAKVHLDYKELQFIDDPDWLQLLQTSTRFDDRIPLSTIRERAVRLREDRFNTRLRASTLQEKWTKFENLEIKTSLDRIAAKKWVSQNLYAAPLSSEQITLIANKLQRTESEVRNDHAACNSHRVSHLLELAAGAASR